MRRERQEFFPHHAGKGSLLSSKDAETGLLWMWAGLSYFLSSGDGYVGELLELQQGCEGSFPYVVGKELPEFPSHLKRRRSTQEIRE